MTLQRPSQFTTFSIGALMCLYGFMITAEEACVPDLPPAAQPIPEPSAPPLDDLRDQLRSEHQSRKDELSKKNDDIALLRTYAAKSRELAELSEENRLRYEAIQRLEQQEASLKTSLENNQKSFWANQNIKNSLQVEYKTLTEKKERKEKKLQKKRVQQSLLEKELARTQENLITLKQQYVAEYADKELCAKHDQLASQKHRQENDVMTLGKNITENSSLHNNLNKEISDLHEQNKQLKERSERELVTVCATAKTLYDITNAHITNQNNEDSRKKFERAFDNSTSNEQYEAELLALHKQDFLTADVLEGRGRMHRENKRFSSEWPSGAIVGVVGGAAIVVLGMLIKNATSKGAKQ